MALHHATKKSAVEKYSALVKEGKPIEDIKLAISLDEKGFDEAGVDEILAAVLGDTKGKPETKKEEKPRVKSQSETLGLDRFDYRNLKGESYEEYLKMVTEKLFAHVQYRFCCYKARPIKKERYPGLRDTPVDIIGVLIESDIPINRTKIEARHAIDLNKQLGNSGMYYLLDKES